MYHSVHFFLDPPFFLSRFISLCLFLSYTKQQYGGTMGPTPSSPYNMYSGPQQQAGMPGYGAPPPQSFPGPPMTMPTMPGYGGLPAAGGLPPGWESRVEPDGRTVYIDHNTKVCRSATACMYCYDTDRTNMIVCLC